MFRLLSNTSEEEWLQDSSLPLTRELTTTSLSTKLDRPETTLHKSSKEETSARTESMRTFTGSPTQIPRLSTGQDLKRLSCQMDPALKPIRTSFPREEMTTSLRMVLMRTFTGSPTQIPRLSTGQDLKRLSCQTDPAQRLTRTSSCKEEMVTFPRKASMRMCTTS